jgi:SAM-dependent methyltransferase
MSWDPTWEDVFRRQSWGKYPAEPLIRFVARGFFGAPIRAEVKFLEVGCGPGANLWFIAREGFQAYGIDGSATGISAARKRLDLECPGWNGELLCNDIDRLPYDDGTFDAVIDNECVYCNPFATACEIYSEMARVTRTGGKLFSRTFASGSWGDRTGTPVGNQAWMCSEGPLAGKGFSRFTSLEDIDELFSAWSIENVGVLTQTSITEGNTIKELIIEGRRE